MLNLDSSLPSIQTPDLVWGWDSPVIRKARMGEISAFVIKHAKWPAELDPSTCQTSELKKGCQQTRWVFSPLNCPNADFSSAKVVLKRYADG